MTSTTDTKALVERLDALNKLLLAKFMTGVVSPQPWTPDELTSAGETVVAAIEALSSSGSSETPPVIWTMEQVAMLNRMQLSAMTHPYTCANRGNHPEFWGDAGVLVATVRGWICPCCDYTQNWAHGVPPTPGPSPADVMAAIEEQTKWRAERRAVSSETQQERPASDENGSVRCPNGHGFVYRSPLDATLQCMQCERDHFAEQLGLVYDHVTNGKLSKPYDLKDVESVLDDSITEYLERRVKEELEEVQSSPLPHEGKKDESRCAVCGWPLAESREKGCARGDCSMRPIPNRFYDVERAEREYGIAVGLVGGNHVFLFDKPEGLVGDAHPVTTREENVEARKEGDQ